MHALPAHRLNHSPSHPAFAGPFANGLFRITFTLAGFYNLAFGLWAAIWPLSFFQLFNIAPPRYPGIWACLGMVVGVYGILYWYAACRFDAAARVIIAVGFLGKILGPIGMLTSFSDDWPRRLGMICVFNDLIWWLPFGLFLIRGTRFARGLMKAAPWICIATHAVALLALAFFLRPGMHVASELAARATYVSAFAVPWSLGWAAWMASAASLVGFYAWWGSYLVLGAQCSTSAAKPDGLRFVAATSAVFIAALGMVFDFAGESSLILRLVESAAGDLADFVRIEREFTLLSAAAANGLYTLGGILLTLLSPDLPHWVRGAMWTTWAAGTAMTLSAIAGFLPGIILSSVVLFPLFLVWVAWLGAYWPVVHSTERKPA